MTPRRVGERSISYSVGHRLPGWRPARRCAWRSSGPAAGRQPHRGARRNRGHSHPPLPHRPGRDQTTSGQWRDGDALFLCCTVGREVAEHVGECLTRGTGLWGRAGSSGPLPALGTVRDAVRPAVGFGHCGSCRVKIATRCRDATGKRSRSAVCCRNLVVCALTSELP